MDIWGRIRRANEASLAELLAREETRRAVTLQIVGGVAQSYFDLRQFDMQLEIAKRTLLAWEESVRIGQARLRQGLINKLDVDQFEAERENAAARIAELKRHMIQKENELSVLLGRNPSQIARGRSLTEQIMPPVVPAGLPSELLQRRPDVVAAEQQLVAATARIGVAKAERFPKLSLTGHSRCGESAPDGFCVAGNQFRSPRPGTDRPLVECPNVRVSTAGRRSPSQTGCGPVRTNGSRRVQGG